MNKKNIILVVLVIAALGVGIWYALSMNEEQNPLAGNKVVAKVNGEEISNEDFQAQLNQTKQMVSQQGLNVEKENLRTRVLDQMIGNILIKQKAKEAGIDVKQEDINTEIDKVKETLGGEEAFSKQLKNADLSKDELEQMTREQLLTQKYIKKQVPEKELEVSNKEVKNYFDQIMAQQAPADATNTPSLSDMGEKQKEQIKSKLKQQKQAQKRQEIIEKLREEADIEKSL